MLARWRGMRATALGSLLLCAGCERFSSSNTICVIPRQASESMWVAEHVGANDAASQYHVNIYWNGPTEEGDVEPQIELADRAIRDHDLGLVLSPNNPFALNTAVERSLEAGIPVAIVGNPVSLPNEQRLTFVLNDERETGALLAHRVEQVLKHHGEVLILGIDPVASRYPDRVAEFETALSREDPDIHVIARVKSAFNFGAAELSAEQTILAHPHLAAIVSLNTEASRGAVAAVNATHRATRINIIGCDYSMALVFLLRHGVIDSLVAQNMRAMGEIAVESVMKESRGTPVPAKIYLKPVLITRDNIDSDPIQWMLYMDWRVRR
jgi:ribose transport system substrate-binding protein